MEVAHLNLAPVIWPAPSFLVEHFAISPLCSQGRKTKACTRAHQRTGDKYAHMMVVVVRASAEPARHYGSRGATIREGLEILIFTHLDITVSAGRSQISFEVKEDEIARAAGPFSLRRSSLIVQCARAGFVRSMSPELLAPRKVIFKSLLLKRECFENREPLLS